MPFWELNTYTPDVDASVAASLLIIHNNIYINACSSKPNFPNMDPPWKGRDSNEKLWNKIETMFKDST